MHGGLLPRRKGRAFVAGLVPVLAVWNNLVVPRLPAGPAWYVVVNSAAAAGLLAAARRSGLSWEDLGLARRRLPAGARLGAACSAAVAGGYAVALAVPALRPFLTDARVSGLDGGEIAYQVFVRIPFGTVVWEEVAFRGVFFAALARLTSVRVATAGSAALFGLWHVRPTLAALAANDLVDGPVLRGAAVLLACLATAGAGVLFTWLRLLSGSLLAPVLLHLAANTLGTVAAAAAHRLP